MVISLMDIDKLTHQKPKLSFIIPRRPSPVNRKKKRSSAMKEPLQYVLGLDIGIESVGWAVIRCAPAYRMEDAGVRLFATAEQERGKSNTNQERRTFRAARRLVRRRSHRKAMVKRHLERIGLLHPGELEAFFEDGSHDLLRLRVKGLDERLSQVELAACLINLCNHRGYREFYPLDEEEEKELTAAERQEREQEGRGIERVKQIMAAGGYRTAAQMLLEDAAFAPADGGPMRVYRSHPHKADQYPLSRDMLRAEAEKILNCQSRFYPCLRQNYLTRYRKGGENRPVEMTNTEFLLQLVFEQRDFEDGPGDVNDNLRRYTGYLSALGKCQFYREENRGARMTALGDLYAAANALSQYRYLDTKTGELVLPPALARELLTAALLDAELPAKKINDIAKAHHVKANNKGLKKAELAPGCIKFLRAVRPVFEAQGIAWADVLGADPLQAQLQPDSLLNRIGHVLSCYQTPRRRQEELRRLPLSPDAAVQENLVKKLAQLHLSGTAKVCEKYMRDAVNAFLSGESYGNFQARLLAEQGRGPAARAAGTCVKLPPFPKDADFAKNPVVARSLNEARKVINAVVARYGSPWAVNLEVASELGRSYAERAEIESGIKKNEAAAEAERKKIAEIMGFTDLAGVSASMLERYRLAELQGWKSLYSGAEFTDKRAVLAPNSTLVEVDHIVPFSLILDNTLHNKALVFAEENRVKGQRVPLEYLTDPAGRKAFIKWVNKLAAEKKISRRKHQYLLLPDLHESGLLDEWKTRNINDTRYIAKYLRGYLERNLKPAAEHRSQFVFPVKGGLTSRFRRRWLNDKTWGRKDKDELRSLTTLHHAVDAVIIANLTPATAFIAEANFRLHRVYKMAGHRKNAEYWDLYNKDLDTLTTYFHYPRALAERSLDSERGGPDGLDITALIERLHEEVDVRFGEPGQDPDPAEYSRRVAAFYHDDPAFAATLRPILTSRKQERKWQGTLTGGNPQGAVEVDGVLLGRTRTNVLELTRKDLDRLYTNDGHLRDTLAAAFAAAQSDKTKLSELLAAQGKTEFRTNKGRLVHKVTLKGGALDNFYIKQIGAHNRSVLETSEYYCVEVYRDTKGQTKVRGIRRIDVTHKDKKLWLTCPYPAEYAEHVMYLFKNDYITVETKNGLMFEGYYQSSSGIKQNKFNGKKKNGVQTVQFRISGTAIVKKYDVDILGRKGGEIRCGAPLSLLPEKN